MQGGFVRLPQALKFCFVLLAVFSVATFGVAQDRTRDTTAENVKLDTLLGNPDQYVGKTVTVEGEMHRTFSDKVFSIEDDDFLRDDDLLIITTGSKADVVTPLEDSIEAGKNVRVTGKIVLFNRAELESKYGPLQIESREGHYKDGDAVMVIERPAATAEFEQALPPTSEALAQNAPVSSQLETRPLQEDIAEPAPPAQEDTTELPRTAGELPLIALGGLASLLAAGGFRFFRR
jgi:hypothetical protein